MKGKRYRRGMTEEAIEWEAEAEVQEDELSAGDAGRGSPWRVVVKRGTGSDASAACTHPIPASSPP